jgi:hypothetical protein
MEVSGQLDAHATLPPGIEPPVPIGLEAWWNSELNCDLETLFLIHLGSKFCPSFWKLTVLLGLSGASQCTVSDLQMIIVL